MLVGGAVRLSRKTIKMVLQKRMHIVMNNLHFIKRLTLVVLWSLSSACGGGASALAELSDDSPTDALLQLSTLLGNISFNFALDGSDTVFTLQSQFERVEQRDSGLLQVLATGRLYSRIAAGSEPVDSGSRAIDCAYNESDRLFLCGVSFTDGAVGYFAFGALVSQRSAGNFKFCTAEDQFDRCLSELLVAPDGSVIVIMEMPEVSPLSLKTQSSQSNLVFDVTADLFMVYLEQGIAQVADVQAQPQYVVDLMRELFISRKQITDQWAGW